MKSPVMPIMGTPVVDDGGVAKTEWYLFFDSLRRWATDTSDLDLPVTMFGATGDGAHDDTAAVQAAFTAAKALGQGTRVVFPQTPAGGSYVLSQTIDITSEYQKVAGKAGKPVIQWNGGANPVFRIPSTLTGGGNYIAFEDLMIQGKNVAGEVGILLSHATAQFLVRRVFFNTLGSAGTGYGIHIAADCNTARIEDCFFGDIRGDSGIYVDGSTGDSMRIDHNLFARSPSLASGWGVRLNNTQGIAGMLIVNNNFASDGAVIMASQCGATTILNNEVIVETSVPDYNSIPGLNPLKTAYSLGPCVGGIRFQNNFIYGNNKADYGVYFQDGGDQIRCRENPIFTVNVANIRKPSGTLVSVFDDNTTSLRADNPAAIGLAYDDLEYMGIVHRNQDGNNEEAWGWGTVYPSSPATINAQSIGIADSLNRGQLALTVRGNQQQRLLLGFDRNITAGYVRAVTAESHPGSMAAGSTTLNVPLGTFVAGDVGSQVIVPWAGTGAMRADLNTTIAAYVSATQVTLAAAATNAVTDSPVIYHIQQAQLNLGAGFAVVTDTRAAGDTRFIVAAGLGQGSNIFRVTSNDQLTDYLNVSPDGALVTINKDLSVGRDLTLTRTFILALNAAAGKVLTSDASGNGTWQTPASSGTVTHTAGALTSGQLLIGNGGGDLKTGNLSGDVTTSGTVATTLKNTGPGAGTYTVGLKLTGGGTNGTITLDAQGRVTAITPAT